MTQPLDIQWPGGVHAFRLRLGEIEAIQSATQCGPEFLLNGFRVGAWHAGHVEAVLKFGLIGGGMARSDAASLVRATIDRGFGLALYKPACLEILTAALYGPEDDPVGKSAAPEMGAETASAVAGSSATS